MTPKALPIAAGLALALGSSAAFAFTLPVGEEYTAGAQLEDDNIDFHRDNDQDGLISEGDDLIAFLEFAQIIDTLASNGTTPPQDLDRAADELVAIADVRVQSVVTVDGVTRVDLAPVGDTAVWVYSLGSEINFDLYAWNNCVDFASCQASIVDGDLWATLGFADPDDEWFFVGSGPAATDPDLVRGTNASTDVGVVNFALSVLVNNTGFTFGDQNLTCGIYACAGDGRTDVVGQSSVLGGLGLPDTLLADGAFARTDTDVQFNAVPEPGMLGVLGLGLGLLGWGARRMNKRA